MQLKRAHHSMPRQSMPTSKPYDMKHILTQVSDLDFEVEFIV